jgi:hypothetical protein
MQAAEAPAGKASQRADKTDDAVGDLSRDERAAAHILGLSSKPDASAYCPGRV